jgi:NADH-quinone oxidoreductase subunit N
MSTVVKTAGFAAFLRIFSFCFAPLQDFWMPILLAITVITLFIGNLTAVYQQSVKRMLAYSSISHVGYLMFAIVALGKTSANAVFLYAAAYSVASIIAFAGVILLQKQTGSDFFDNFNGLSKKNPFLAFTITVAMLSLAGIPLTAGFIGKFMMFGQALEQYRLWLVVIGVVNASIGIYYYFKVIIAMYFKDNEMKQLTVPTYYKIVLTLSTAVTILLGVYPDLITNLL